jgi:mono/diheme cytochrome c family protein
MIRPPLTFILGDFFRYAAITLLLLTVSVHAADTNSAGLEFFESKIRPVLAESCYSCHSAKSEKLKGGLKLDTRDAVLKGGDSGPALIAGKPDQSLLIKAIRYSDPNLEMPPKGKKLSAEQIADFEKWVAMGAPDPRTNSVTTNQFAIDWVKAREHWAFKPVQSPPVPKVKNSRAVLLPVDAFILARLETNALSISPATDKRTLLRRASFDLIGLPPTAEEVEAFEKDKSPDAFTKVVDRLLVSPHYGERWGRYWLDVARYSDTKGYVGGNEEPRYPFAYTFRDWVVRAFNEDLPFDQFIIQQLAADLLPQDTNDNRSLAAMGFLTVGRRFLGNENDVIDDRIDVVCRGLMGLTVTCARCHDHKYDPIPTRDYYSLYGVFKSTTEPTNALLITPQTFNAEYTNYLAEVVRRQTIAENYYRSNELAVLKNLRTNVAAYLMTVHEAQGITNNTKLDEFVRGRKLNNAIYRGWKTNLANWATNGHSIFTPWTEFAKLATNDYPAKAAELAQRFTANEGTNQLNPLVVAMFKDAALTNLVSVAQLYGDLFQRVERDWDLLVALSNAPTVVREGEGWPQPPAALVQVDAEVIRQFCFTTNSPLYPREFMNNFLFLDDVKNKVESLRRDIKSVDGTHAGAPARAMSMLDRGRISSPRVFIRGNPGTPGPDVKRQFLEVVSGENRTPFPTNTSGRLQLAQAIVARDNPLTARVFVNRVWMHHFGAGLVRTPSDFGLRADAPTHLELLDYLATQFMDNGWSVKKLHRLIMLSSAYQQASGVEDLAASRGFFSKLGFNTSAKKSLAKAAQLDPENKLLWRQNRQRLDFEAMRDSFLKVSAQLDLSVGGQPVDIVTNLGLARRTIYGFIDRQDLPNVFRTFDFANPDASVGQRFQTTVAPQALFLLNSPFVTERAKALVAQTNFQTSANGQRVTNLYRTLLQRPPTLREVKLAQQFIADSPEADMLMPEISNWHYGFGSYDETVQRVTEFNELTKFTGTAWQAGTNAAEKTIGSLTLLPDGGRPAPTNTIAAVRRWVAPHDGEVSIEGDLKTTEARGDGVRARIVCGNTGLLGEWTATTNSVRTAVKVCAVKKGDTIDFAVDCLGDATGDTFKWAPLVTMVDAESKAAMMKAGQPTVWDAKANFVDPAKLPKTLGAWEKLAQVLLLSNEFAFVD